jgi:Chemotaxis signal transduction protein
MSERLRVLPSFQKDIKIICASVGEEIYGIGIEYLEEVIKLSDDILYVHSDIKYLKGLIYIRGEIVPVFDILSFFEIGEIKEQISKKLGIIVRALKDVSPICLIADNVFIETISPNSISEAPKVGIKFREIIIGRVNTPRGSITLIDPHKILERHREISRIKEEVE